VESVRVANGRFLVILPALGCLLNHY